jgi:hypothetical protein
MEGVGQMMQDLVQEQSDILSLEALKSLLCLMKTDDYVCIKMVKLKLLSNLLSHSVNEFDGANENILSILEAFRDNKHRSTLLEESREFQPEKEKLEVIAKDLKNKITKEHRSVLN